MRKKKNQRVRQIGILVFLFLIALGFMVPGFIDPTEGEESYSEPRLCQSDADCYLLCDDKPIASLCSQNLCMQNSCEEKSYYEYNLNNPISFSLSIEIDSEIISFVNRTNVNDIFITFNNDQVKLFSSGLTIKHVVNKLGFFLDGQCIQIDFVHYCNNDEKELRILVNGELSGAFENYIPKQGDKVRIEYSSIVLNNET